VLFLCLAGNFERRGRLKSLAAFFVPVVVGGVLTCTVNWIRWGSPLDFGYHSSHERFSAAPWIGLTGLLVSPGKGLFLYAPVVLVAWIFARRIRQRGSAEFWLIVSITSVHLGTYCRWYDWPGGASWGPRFLVPLIAPWIALLGRAIFCADNRTASRALAASAACGFGVQCLGLCVAPHWMSIYEANPFQWEKCHLVQSARFFWEHGPDDL
jgi:hypothetical protein